MPNKKSAGEWLTKAYHSLSAAQILLDAEHFTDIIGMELQQSTEKILKSLLAYENKSIPKTHELISIADQVSKHLTFDDEETNLLLTATEYYSKERYPVQNRTLPPVDEIQQVLSFTWSLFDRVCHILGFDKNEFMKR